MTNDELADEFLDHWLPDVGYKNRESAKDELLSTLVAARSRERQEIVAELLALAGPSKTTPGYGGGQPLLTWAANRVEEGL